MRKFLTGKSGASIVIALILMIVFLTIGASVLTASSASLHGAGTQREEKQLYYFARSVADTVTDSLTTYFGQLWTPVNKMIVQNPGQRVFHCTLSAEGLPGVFLKDSAPGALPQLNMEPLEFTVSNVVTTEESGTAVLEAVGKMTIGFIVYYKDSTYRMYADYKYRRPTEPEETGWSLVKYYQ